MKTFTAKYGIKITDLDPEGTSQDELNAVKQLNGQSSAPDVVDVDSASAAAGQSAGYWAPYKVATWDSIPTWARDGSGGYYAAYGGYMAIGYEPSIVKVAKPTSVPSRCCSPATIATRWRSTALPTQFGSSLAAVYAASLANGGSLANIAPGVRYFQDLERAANFAGSQSGAPDTMQSGRTPIMIWWDYLLNSQVRPVVKNLQIVIPKDGVYESYYDQAIQRVSPRTPPPPGCGKSFLYSAEGWEPFP